MISSTSSLIVEAFYYISFNKNTNIFCYLTHTATLWKFKSKIRHSVLSAMLSAFNLLPDYCKSLFLGLLNLLTDNIKNPNHFSARTIIEFLLKDIVPKYNQQWTTQTHTHTYTSSMHFISNVHLLINNIVSQYNCSPLTITIKTANTFR